MGYHMMYGWDGYGVFGMFLMFLFWALIVLGIIALVRNFSSSGPAAKDSKTPADILKERYAKGEIDKKEFDEKMKVLS